MKVLYKPIGLILGHPLRPRRPKRIFDFVWTKIDDEDPPKGTTQHAPWVKILGAAALQGVIFKSTRVVVDRYGARRLELPHGRLAGREAPGPRRI